MPLENMEIPDKNNNSKSSLVASLSPNGHEAPKSDPNEGVYMGDEITNGENDALFMPISVPKEEETFKTTEPDVGVLFVEVVDITELLRLSRPDIIVDPNKLFADLESLSTDANRKQIVLDKWLKVETSNDVQVIPFEDDKTIPLPRPDAGEEFSLSEKSDKNVAGIVPDIDDQWNTYQELVREVDVVKKYVPNTSPEEIFAYLEAFHGNPNRIPIVIRELTGDDELAKSAIPSLPQLPLDKRKSVHIDLTNDGDGMHDLEFQLPADLHAQPDIPMENEPQPSTSGQKATLSPNEESYKTLSELFPDADPGHLWDVVNQCEGNVDVFQANVANMLESKNYPKLSDVQKAATNQKCLDRNFSIEELLQTFENPEVYFNDINRPVNGNYKQHVIAHVTNSFPYVYKNDLTAIFEKQKYHLTPVIKNLSELCGLDHFEEPTTKRKKTARLKRKTSPTPRMTMPVQPDELFYKELAYLEMEDQIKIHREKKENERKSKVAVARAMGALMTCNCCFEEELLIEDMLPCNDGHLFCRDCIRRSAEVNIGLSKFKFPCFNAYCEFGFSLLVLQHVLKPTIFSNLFRKMQEEEIRQADLPDLVSCPFCTFCAIMPDPDDKVFKCQNPDCLKETCRLCKEPNHVPLRCDEIEKKPELDMRTYIENKMTDALLRTCPKCGRRFIKDFGCNKMTCQCGQQMCYVCRQPINDYSHFQNGKCPQYSNDAELHRLEIQKGAENAREKYLQEHPELADVKLKHDPTKDIPPAAAARAPNPHIQHGAMPVLDNGNIVFQGANNGARNRLAMHVGPFPVIPMFNHFQLPPIPLPMINHFQIPPIPPVPNRVVNVNRQHLVNQRIEVVQANGTGTVTVNGQTYRVQGGGNLHVNANGNDIVIRGGNVVGVHQNNWHGNYETVIRGRNVRVTSSNNVRVFIDKNNREQNDAVVDGENNVRVYASHNVDVISSNNVNVTVDENDRERHTVTLTSSCNVRVSGSRNVDVNQNCCCNVRVTRND